MKKAILILVMFLTPLLGRGDGGEVCAQQPQIDSLNKLLSNHQNHDEEQLRLYLAVADAEELSNQTKGIAAADNAIELAQKLNMQQELASAHNLKARLLLMKQLPDKANEALQKSFAINRSLNNKKQLAENTLTVAQFIVCQQKNDTTITYIDKSMQLFLNSGNNLALGKSYLFNGLYYAFLNTDKAAQFYVKAKSCFEKTNRKDWLMFCDFSMATNYTSLNQNEKALAYFDKLEVQNKEVQSEFLKQNIYCTRGYLYSSMAENPKALDNFIKGLKIAETIGDAWMQASMLNNIGTTFGEMGNFEKARTYFDKQIELAQKLNDKSILSLGHQNYANIFFEQQKYKEALTEAQLSLKLALEAKQPDHIAESYGLVGKVYEKLGMYSEAFTNLQLALSSNKQQGNFYNICDNLLTLSRTINNSGTIKLVDAIGGSLSGNEKINKAIYFTSEALSIADSLNMLSMQRDALKQLSDLYKAKQDDKKSFEYFKQYVAVKDSIMSSENLKSINNLQLQYETEKKEKEIALLNKDKEIKQKEISKKTTERNGFIAGFILVLMIGGVAYNRYRIKQKTNKQLELTLNELHQTQQQLIEQEKFASVGQLTAGIAHEIQNPLNFVINFSELSNDLFVDLENSKDANEQQEIIHDLDDNISKIERHTNRADGIVKSMLLHARDTGFEKQLTNVNELCREAFDFAWQSVRINAPGFNCVNETEYAENIPQLKLNQQDISRVLINLLNNAFYAVREKSLELNPDYKPTVALRTQLINNQIIISVKDNGNGIPEEIKNKIFQPFFTTKPTNLGTGLGLSISYDIVKAHGGNITAESIDNAGSTFKISLPLST